ncbi:MAG: hypothetical protein JWP40_4030 [Blastococcus sp.]|nr:hypothetical protein [Blastococcus sp.]
MCWRISVVANGPKPLTCALGRVGLTAAVGGCVGLRTKSPLGHVLAPVSLQVRGPGRCHSGAQNGLVIPP